MSEFQLQANEEAEQGSFGKLVCVWVIVLFTVALTGVALKEIEETVAQVAVCVGVTVLGVLPSLFFSRTPKLTELNCSSV